MNYGEIIISPSIFSIVSIRNKLYYKYIAPGIQKHKYHNLIPTPNKENK